MADINASFAQLDKGIRIPIPGATTVRVVPATAVSVRLLGMLFDLNKCFLLPSVMKGIREIKKQYDAHPGSDVLVVGHTDTSGSDDPNLTLSLERADSVSAYMRDDVPAWEKFFGEGISEEKRWGTRELQFMLSALPEGQAAFYEREPTGKLDKPTEEAIKDFQVFRDLKVDGIPGEKTRKALITDYMALDGTSLPSGISIKSHGCGESFPTDLSDAALKDPALRAGEIKNGVRKDADRRVEVYFFDGPIVPAPAANRKSGKLAVDYPKWLSQVVETIDVSQADSVVRDTPLPTTMGRLPLVFRRFKSFPGPDGLAMLRQIATQMQGDPDPVAVVVGHTDSFGADAENDTLSLNRAKAVAAWLSGDAAFFKGQFAGSDANARWGLMEADEMIQAIRAPDAFPAPLQPGQDSFSLFQASKGLPQTGLLDGATQDAIIQDYLALLGTTPIPAAGIRTVGGGRAHSIFPMGPNDAVSEEGNSPDYVDPRRAEVFLFAGADAPAVDDAIAKPSAFPSVYKTWCRSGSGALDAPTGNLRIRFDDGSGNPAANKSVALHRSLDADHELDETVLAQTVTDANGIATFTLDPASFTVATGDVDNRDMALVRSKKRFPNRFAISLQPAAGA